MLYLARNESQFIIGEALEVDGRPGRGQPDKPAEAPSGGSVRTVSGRLPTLGNRR